MVKSYLNTVFYVLARELTLFFFIAVSSFAWNLRFVNPIVLTRDMEKAKSWLHDNVKGTERTGVLITKESARFKPLGVHVFPSGDGDAVHWFLEDKIDTRSSNYLEDATTEI